MIDDGVLKSIIHALLIDAKLLESFSVYFDARFFNGNQAYVATIDIAQKYNKQYKTRINMNVLIEHIAELSKVNKQLSNIFSNISIEDFIKEIYGTPYDSQYIADRICLELKNTHAFKVMEAALMRKEKDPMFNIFDHVHDELAKLYTKFDNLVHVKEEIVLSDMTVEEMESACDNSYSYDDIIHTKLPTFDKYKMYLDSNNAELGLVIAPPSKGKTATLSFLALRAAMAGHAVLYFEGETPKEVMKKRHAQSINVMTTEQIASRQYKEYMVSQAQAIQRVGGLYVLKMFRYGEFTVNDIESSVIDYIEKHGRKPQCIFLDYADLLKPLEYQAEYRLKLKQIFIELKALCSKLKVACWTASQTSKSGLNVPLIDMDNISEDFSKNMIVDKAFSINRPKHKNNNESFFYIVKNRDGWFDKLIKVEADFTRMHFREIEEVCDVGAWKEANKPIKNNDEKKKK